MTIIKYIAILALFVCLSLCQKKVIYIDDGNWNDPASSITGAADAGFNVIILAFYMHTGSSDFLQAWEGLNETEKQSTVETLHGKGASLIVSFGGGADADPYVVDAYSAGYSFGQYAKSQYLDGFDFDLENFDQGFTVDGNSAEWTIEFCINITRGASDGFGPGAIITHAPQSPFFGAIGATNTWAGPSGGYTAVYNGISDILSFFNVQFYNQGNSCYVSYNSLFNDGNAEGCGLPGSSVSEINQAGVPLSAIIVGKPVHSGDAGDGWVDGNTLNQWFSQASQSLGWNGGIMGWEWTDDGTTTSWLQSIYPN